MYSWVQDYLEESTALPTTSEPLPQQEIQNLAWGQAFLVWCNIVTNSTYLNLAIHLIQRF